MTFLLSLYTFFLILNFILKSFFPVFFRQKRSAPKEEPEKIDEEEWNMKDVIFVEDSRNMPIGRVIKVDGQHTVVHFPVGGEKNPPVPAGPAGNFLEKNYKTNGNLFKIMDDCLGSSMAK